MSDEAQTPMTIDDAAASLLMPEDEPERQEPAADEAPVDPDVNDLDEAPADEADQPDDEDPDAEQEDGEEEEDIPPPPVSWSKEDAKAWNELTPAARDVVMRREAERDRFVREKARESATHRQQVENEALNLLATERENQAKALEVLASAYAPRRPDPAMLYSQDQNVVMEYHRQMAAYEAAAAQHNHVQQAMTQAQQEATQLRQAQDAQAMRQEQERLQDALPEWFDPSVGPKLKAELQSIGAELGYPEELMAQAGANDILALKKAADWRAKAAKYDKLMSKKMEGVRAAKALPKVGRPGAQATRGQSDARTADRMEASIREFNETRSPEAAAALLLQRIR